MNNFFHFMKTKLFCFMLSFIWSITMFTFRLILNDHVWCFFLLIFESILLIFWLQNRYKSSTLKPKNWFYLCFGYKIGINQMFWTDWDPKLKVHRVVMVLWRFTNPDPNPNRFRTELLYNPNETDFDKFEKPRSDWTKPKSD